MLARYNNNGTLDTSFGTGGLSNIDIPGNSCPDGYGCGDELRALALQSDGKIVATGAWVSWGAFPGGVGSSSKTNMLTARFTATGALDTSFDADGYVITTVAPGFYTDIGNSIGVQSRRQDRRVRLDRHERATAGNFARRPRFSVRALQYQRQL